MNDDVNSMPTDEAPVAERKAGMSFRNPWVLGAVALLLGATLSSVGNSSTISGLRRDLAASNSKLATGTGERDALSRQLVDTKAQLVAAQAAPAEPAAAQPVAVEAPNTQEAAFRSAFTEGRAELLTVLEDDDNVESVDKLAYDAKKKVVIVDITSAWASPDNQEDGAWALTRAMAELWTPDTGAWWQDDFLPGFKLVNSGKVYQCSGSFMVKLGDASASRGDWKKETK